jgi:hypothetical protein
MSPGPREGDDGRDSAGAHAAVQADTPAAMSTMLTIFSIVSGSSNHPKPIIGEMSARTYGTGH